MSRWAQQFPMFGAPLPSSISPYRFSVVDHLSAFIEFYIPVINSNDCLTELEVLELNKIYQDRGWLKIEISKIEVSHLVKSVKLFYTHVAPNPAITNPLQYQKYPSYMNRW